ncbi:hypothetical protein ES703_123677 [subsurface metagenome]
MNEAYCPECGKTIKKESVICPYCKTQVKEFEIAIPEVKYKDKRILCPVCSSTQIATGTKGYDVGKGVLCGLLFFFIFPLGFLFGLIGSNKIIVTCISCGYKWYAGRKGM